MALAAPDAALAQAAAAPADEAAIDKVVVNGFRASLASAINVYARVRYFDPARKRAGVPQDVAALVETMDADTTDIRLVHLSANATRTVVIQGGGYGEHQIVSAVADGRETPVNARSFTVRLAPRAGGRLTLKMRRYANQPRLAFPWAV